MATRAATKSRIRSGEQPPDYNEPVARRPELLASAYAACERLAQSHYENFPVASRLLPSEMRPHVAAVYAFARVADDIADEGSASMPARLHGLRQWQAGLHERLAAGDRPAADRDALILTAVAHSIRTLQLPVSLFDDLVSAFGQDTMTTRYASWDELFDYCRRSANPIGRLVLRIAGHRDEALDRSSDALCTALQLTNFWQDLGPDLQKGRLYVPAEVFGGCAADPEELTAGRMSSEWVESVRACAAVTRRCFQEGRRVCDGVSGRLKFELRVTWVGGLHVLEKVERLGPRLLRERPTLAAADVPRLLWRATRWTDVAA